MTSTSSTENAPASETGPVRARYEKLSSDREPYLRRARACAKLTIPSLMPPAGSTGSTEFYQPFQSVGARGINHLAAKLLLALFPPGSSFFRLTLDPFTQDELRERAGDQVQDAVGEFEGALAKIEQAVIGRLEETGARTKLYEELRRLLVSGNTLIQILENGGFRLFHLDSFVVRRNPRGEVVEIIVHERIEKVAAPEQIKEIVARNSGSTNDPHVDVYTHIRKGASHWTIVQEVLGQQVPQSYGTYPLDKPAWLVQGFSVASGESYSRSFVEEYLGDLSSLESLSQSLVEGAAAAARILFFVDESGVTSKDEVAEAANGAVLEGTSKDVTTLQLDKYADFRVALEQATKIEQRLAQVFLLFSDLPRHAERVTATEIQQIVTELEDSLGGLYSVLAEELQRPLAVRIMHQMEKSGDLPSLPDGTVSPRIVTGLEALGRNHDLLKLDLLIQGANTTFGPEAVAEYINVGAYLRRRAAALAVITDGLIRSDAEVAEERALKQQAEMVQSLAGPGLKFAGDRMAAGEAAAASEPAQ